MDFVLSNLMTTEMPMMPVTNVMDEIFLERGKKPAIFFDYVIKIIGGVVF